MGEGNEEGKTVAIRKKRRIAKRGATLAHRDVLNAELFRKIIPSWIGGGRRSRESGAGSQSKEEDFLETFGRQRSEEVGRDSKVAAGKNRHGKRPPLPLGERKNWQKKNQATEGLTREE